MNEDEYEIQCPIDAERRMAGKREQRVRATIAPEPKHLRYPAPWRVAETIGNQRVVVACAAGHYTAECPSLEAAEAIVLAVNTFAGSAE